MSEHGNEEFSDEDKYAAWQDAKDRNGGISFLGTPKGKIKRYDPPNIGIPGKTTILGKCE